MVEWVEGNREVTRYNNSIHGTSAAVALYWDACLDCRKPEIGSGVRVSVVMGNNLQNYLKSNDTSLCFLCLPVLSPVVERLSCYFCQI